MFRTQNSAFLMRPNCFNNDIQQCTKEYKLMQYIVGTMEIQSQLLVAVFIAESKLFVVC